MTTFDRYMTILFARILFVSFLSLTGLFIVIDAFGNLDEFLKYAETEGGLLKVLIDYYGPRVLSFFDRTCALLALCASVFVITWLQKSNELTALMAAGIPKTRVVRPLIAIILLVSAFGVVNREYFLPSVRDKLTRNAQNWLGTAAKSMRPTYDNRTDILLMGKGTLATEQKIVQPTFRLPPTLAMVGKQLIADEAIYVPANEHHPAGYWMKGVSEPSDLAQQPTGQIRDEAVVWTPRDYTWLANDECFVASELAFEQLAADREWRQYASAAELIRTLHNPSYELGADVRVTLHARFVQPVLDVTLVFLGLPLVLTRRQGNAFVAAGKCLLMVAVFFVVVLACHASGSNYLIPPALAAWLPVLIFTPAAYALAVTLKR